MRHSRKGLSARAAPWVMAAVGLVAVVAIADVVVIGRHAVNGSSSRSSPTVASTVPVDPAVAYVRAVRAGASGSLIVRAPDSYVLQLGRGVCTLLDKADPAHVDAGLLAAASAKVLPAADVVTVVIAAGSNLCPQHRVAVLAWSRKPAPGGAAP